MNGLVIGAMMALSMMQQTDTTFALDGGERLSVETMGGSIEVLVWDEDRIRVQAEHSNRTFIDIHRHNDGRQIDVEAEARRGPANIVDFRITVPPEHAGALQGLEQWLGRPVKEIFLGRVKDVLIVSDNDEWVEDAIRGGRDTLKADAWFETEFIERSRGPRDVEMFMRPHLAARLLQEYGRDDTGGPLFPVSRFLPAVMTGEVTVRAGPRPSGVDFALTNNPPPNAFGKLPYRHLIDLYQYEKADLSLELSENGIARFIPKDRTVGALVLRAKTDDLVDLFLEFIPRARLELFNEQVRETPGPTGRRYQDLASVLRELMKDFGDMHMLVLHRPKVFEGRDYASFQREFEVPPPTLIVTLVSRIQDHVAGDQVRRKVSDHLRVLQLNPLGADQGGKFHVAEPVEAKDEDELKLVRPAFGGMTGNMKYFVFSMNPEGAEAVMRAGEDSQARMITEPSVQAALGTLPPKGTLAMIVRGEMVRLAMWDEVRKRADESFRIPTRRGEWAELHRRPGMSDADLLPLVQEEQDRFIATHYPDFRDRWRVQIAPWSRVDTIVVAATLGEGPVKGAKAQAYVHFRLPDTSEDDPPPRGE